MPSSRDRAAMREKARNRTEPLVEKAPLSQPELMKTIASVFDEDGKVIPAERSEAMKVFDECSDVARTIADVYEHFKMPCSTDNERGAALDLLDEVILRKGVVAIRSLAKANALKSFCADLLRDVRVESNDRLKYKLCVFIGDVARRRTDNWPELQRFIRTSFSSADLSHKRTALELIGYGTSPVCEWSTVKDLIVESILGSESTLHHIGTRALSSFVRQSCNDDKEMMDILERLTPVVLERARTNCSQDNCDSEHSSPLNCLNQIGRETPRVLRKHVEEILNMCISILLNPIEPKGKDNRHTALQLMCIVSQKYASSVPASLIPDIVMSSLLSIAIYMDEMKEWLAFNPAKDRGTLAEDFATAIGHWYFEKIASALGKKRMLSHLMNITQQFLNNEDWKKRAAALIGLGVVGDSFRRGRVVSFVDCALSAVNDDHPRVRHSSCSLLASVFCTFNLNDQPNRLEKVLPTLISLLSDSIPRMVAIAVSALSRFSSQCPQDILVAKYDVLLPLLISILRGCPEDGPKNVPCPTFETLSYMAKAVGKDRFLKDFPEVVSAMSPILKSLVPSESSDSSESRLSILTRTILESGERICAVIEVDCAPLLSIIIDKIDMKKVGHRFLAILIKATDTDIVDGTSSKLEDERRIAPFVKQISKTAECVEQAELSEEERETLIRIIKSPEE